jgi:hypothetical protein
MKIDELLNQRSDENVIYDFSDLSRDELMVFVNSRIYGEESLSDEEMKILESGTAKIKTRPGKPRKHTNKMPAFNPETDDPMEWLKKRIESQ